MSYATGVPHEFTASDRDGRLGVPLHLVAAGLAIALGVSAGLYVLNTRQASVPLVGPAPVVAAAILAPPTYVALLDAAYSLGVAPDTLDRSMPLGPNFTAGTPPPPALLPGTAPQAGSLALPLLSSAATSPEPEAVLPAAPDNRPPLAESAPLPTPRPPEVLSRSNPGPVRASARQIASQARASAPVDPPADNRNFIEKLFGMPQPSAGPALAYATPGSGLLGIARSLTSNPVLPYDRWTAVYDIAAHTVYMPNGARLEAHSGLGDRLDDPRHVSDRNRGATPPHVYALEPRAQLFHGVQALRLTPLGGGEIFGRTGLLAHSYMLGPNGDSNGCVSFRDYHAFLQAYLSGEIKRLVVVQRLG